MPLRVNVLALLTYKKKSHNKMLKLPFNVNFKIVKGKNPKIQNPRPRR
jgi:hypothetical protein